jgi:hypothetical protein
MVLDRHPCRLLSRHYDRLLLRFKLPRVPGITLATEMSSPHVHVERDENTAKFWLVPVRLQGGGCFIPTEVRQIQRLVEEHRQELLRSWGAYFSP